MEQRTNAGYLITNSVQIGACEFVLGVNQKCENNYVTWKCADGNNYYWGHYFSDRFSGAKGSGGAGLWGGAASTAGAGRGQSSPARKGA